MAFAGHGELLDLLRKIPPGRVASVDRIAAELGRPAAVVRTMLAQLSDDEREVVPWHRVVAKGGAIGRGPYRDEQFARLVREGVMVSPAAIVQDLARQMISDFEEASLPKNAKPTESPGQGGRSRGMKERP